MKLNEKMGGGDSEFNPIQNIMEMLRTEYPDGPTQSDLQNIIEFVIEKLNQMTGGKIDDEMAGKIRETLNVSSIDQFPTALDSLGEMFKDDGHDNMHGDKTDYMGIFKDVMEGLQ
jgi:hypothetical protein